jgi:transposase
LLSIVSQGFVAFEHANQLIASVGLAPRIDQSGKTILKNHISKQATAQLRKVLYLAGQLSAIIKAVKTSMTDC